MGESWVAILTVNIPYEEPGALEPAPIFFAAARKKQNGRNCMLFHQISSRPLERKLTYIRSAACHIL